MKNNNYTKWVSFTLDSYAIDSLSKISLTMRNHTFLNGKMPDKFANLSKDALKRKIKVLEEDQIEHWIPTSDEDDWEPEYSVYFPVYSFALSRKDNAKLINLHIDAGWLWIPFMEFHKSDLIKVIGPKKYKKILKTMKAIDRYAYV